jgi:hypothetical protein
VSVIFLTAKAGEADSPTLHHPWAHEPANGRYQLGETKAGEGRLMPDRQQRSERRDQ